MTSLVSEARSSASNRRRTGSVSIRDVAQRAGVSIATVSRAVNRIPTVNAELARRVWEAIDEVGYLPNTQARALVSGRSKMLGLIVSEITNPFFPELVQEFENLAVAQGYEEMCIRDSGNRWLSADLTAEFDILIGAKVAWLYRITPRNIRPNRPLIPGADSPFPVVVLGNIPPRPANE